MTLIVLVGYLIGGLSGFLASLHESFTTSWRRLIRAQLLFVSASLSLLAGWRLSAIGDLIWPVVVTAVAVSLVVIGYLITPRSADRHGRAVLRGWSAIPNPAFWVVPVAAAIAGPAGAVIAVFIDRAMIFVFGFFVWTLRHNAPIKQKIRTSWIDQAPLIALVVGLVLNYYTDPPAWTEVALEGAAPLLAAVGAAMFIGSVLHPTQRIPWRPGVGVWVLLVAVRICLLVPLAFVAPSPAIAAVLVLCAFSIPTFYPPQLSILYGYADNVVAAASRLGWFLAPIGVVAAAVIVRM